MLRSVLMVVGVCLVLACPTGAMAQPEPDYPEASPAPPAPEVAPAPVPYPPPPPALYPGDRRRYEKERRRQIHHMLLDTNPDYRAAVSRRNSGIIVASVVGGVGLLVGLIGGMVTLACGAAGGDCDDAKAWTIGGFLAMGVGLGVGIPLAVSGQGQVKAMRREAMRVGWLPRLNLAVGGSRGRVGLTWRF